MAVIFLLFLELSEANDTHAASRTIILPQTPITDERNGALCAMRTG
jgi:hypothetical protein